jgi:hypothetical protein
VVKGGVIKNKYDTNNIPIKITPRDNLK